ncbi:hypothetical protein ACFL2H_08525 [Planctomycetota bacterium]
MRKTKLRKTKFGVTRNLGFKLTKTGQRSQPKFYLGEDPEEAERRFRRIEELWRHVEKTRPDEPLWDSFELYMAKELANGELQIPIGRTQWQDGHAYAVKLNGFSNRYPMINFVPSDPEAYSQGLDFNRRSVQHQMLKMKENGLIVKEDQPVYYSSETLHRSLNRYIEYIKSEYFDKSEGHVSDAGNTLIRQVRTLLYQIDDLPLAILNDRNAVQAVYDVFRKRPVSKRYGTVLKISSCRNYIGALDQFFKWLETTTQEWRKPVGSHLIRKDVHEFDSDVDEEADEIPVYTKDHLRVLNQYATPLERVFVLLGLNCAFGADQTGRLKVNEIRRLKNGRTIIKRVRRKKKVLGQHLLWHQTVQGVEWAMKVRETRSIQPEAKDRLLITANGTSYWRKTASGNRARDIPNRWYDLLDRVQQDHPDFPRHGFNTLRDTSINLIRRLAGQEVASTHATHKHQSQDRHLRNYSNPPWKRLFRAQAKLERQLKDVFDAAPDPPFEPQTQAYISLMKSKRILEMDDAGVPKKRIATELGVSYATVCRRVKEKRNNQLGTIAER